MVGARLTGGGATPTRLFAIGFHPHEELLYASPIVNNLELGDVKCPTKALDLQCSADIDFLLGNCRSPVPPCW